MRRLRPRRLLLLHLTALLLDSRPKLLSDLQQLLPLLGLHDLTDIEKHPLPCFLELGAGILDSLHLSFQVLAVGGPVFHCLLQEELLLLQVCAQIDEVWPGAHEDLFDLVDLIRRQPDALREGRVFPPLSVQVLGGKRHRARQENGRSQKASSHRRSSSAAEGSGAISR